MAFDPSFVGNGVGFAYGISIMGFGIGRGSLSGGDYRDHLEVRFSTVNRILDDGSKNDRIYVDSLGGESGPGISSMMPEIRSLRVSPFEGSGQFGGLTARIQIDKHKGPLSVYYKGKSPSEHLADFLMGGTPKPWGRVWATASAAYIENIDVSPNSPVGEIYAEKYRGRDALAVGDLIHWGRELLMVNSVTDNARLSSPQSAYPKVTSTLFLNRGVCGSRQETHKLGDYDDVEIYTRNNVLKGRDARVYRLNLATGFEQLIWEGILSEANMSDSLGFVEISGNGSIAWSGELRPGWKRAYWSFDQSQRDAVSGATKSVHVRNDEIATLPDSTADMVVLRGDALQPIRLIRSQDHTGGLFRYEVAGTLAPIMGTYADRKKSEKTDEQAPPMKEVLVGARGFSHFYDADAEEYRLHPLDIIRCLLCSTGTGKNGAYDLLPTGWGLGFPSDRVDHADIDRLKGPEFGYWYLAELEMNNLLIGNQDETFLQVFERILKPILCFLTITSENKITVRHFTDPGPGAVIGSYTPNSMTKTMTSGACAYDPRTDIRYKISRRGASGEYSAELVATNIRRSEASSYRSIATDEEVDALDYGDPTVTSGTLADTALGQSLQALAALRYDLLRSGLQEWEASVQDFDTQLTPGSCINVSYPAIINPVTGGRGISLERCMVIEHSIEPGLLNQGLTIVNVGSMARGAINLAPSWRITAFNEDFKEITVADDGDALLGGKRSWLQTGMVCTLANPDGEILQGTAGVRAITLIDISTGEISIPTVFGVTLLVGMYIILCSYDQLSPSHTINLGYCHIADIDGNLIDENDDEVSGNNWGF